MDLRAGRRGTVAATEKCRRHPRDPFGPDRGPLRIALDASDGELVFPECGQAAHRDELRARGMQLRRTYRTIAADVGVDEMLSHFLLSHAPAGISQPYVARLILQSGQAMREAQRKISRRIVDLLGLRN